MADIFNKTRRSMLLSASAVAGLFAKRSLGATVSTSAPSGKQGASIPGTALSSALETSVGNYGVVSDGTDQTKNLQAAINAVSAAGGGTLKFAPHVTIITGCLIPKPGVLIDLNDSTLKLSDDAKVPIFYDGGASQGGDRFGVINGTLDCNQIRGNSGRNVMGGVWLTGWSNLDFRRLVIKNCYRIGINLIDCRWFSVVDYRFEDSGIAGSNHFAYALNIEGYRSRYFEVKRVAVCNVIGYGVHFFGCSDFTADNLSFHNMTYVNGAAKSIAITFTQASRFTTSNVIASQIAGDSIEINSCADGAFNNYNIQQSGRRALLVGVNGTGPNNTRLRFNNLQILGTSDTYAASISYLEACEFNEMSLDKPVSYNVASTTSKNNVIRNSDIMSTAAASVGLINKGYFILENVQFTDWVYRQLSRQSVILDAKQKITAGESFDISFLNILPGLLISDGSVGGTLKTLTRFVDSHDQGSLQTCQFLVNAAGTVASLSAITQVDNNVARPLNITSTAASRKITLANPSLSGSGIDLDVSINLDMIVFS